MSSLLWLPRVRSFLRSTVLVVATIPLVVLLRMVGEMAFNFLEVQRQLDRFGLWLLLAGVIVPVYYLGFIDQWLWGNPPPNQTKWFPCLQSLGEGLFSWVIMLLCMTLVAIPGVIADPDGYGKNLTDEAVAVMTFFWWLLMAYCYHVRWLLGRWWQRVAKKKPQADKHGVK